MVAAAGAAVVAALCLATLKPVNADAAFAASTGVGSNQWGTGTVALGSATNAVISVTGTIPGSFGSSCVKITYNASSPANIRLYLRAADVTGTGLGAYLTLQIKQGSGNNNDCSDFVASGTLYNPTGLTDTTKKVTTFSAASSNYSTGVDNWAATTNPETRTYQFNWQLQDDNAAQSGTATLAFTWEAQSV